MIRGLVPRLVAFVRSKAAIYLAGTVLSRIGALFLIPVYTRRLTPDEYGEYSLAVSLIALLPLCGSLGLTGGLSRVYFGSSDRQIAERAFGAVARGLVITVLALLGALALGVGAFGGSQLVGISRYSVLLAIAASVGIACGLAPNVYFRAAQRPLPAVALDLTNFFLTAGLGVFFVAGLGRGLRGALEAAAVAALSIGVFGVWWILRRLPSGAVVRETKHAVLFSLPFIPHFLASWAQVTADRWILSVLGTPAMLGTYYVAVQLSSPVAMVTAAWNDAEAPRFGEAYRDKGAVGAFATLRSASRAYFVITLLPAVALLAASPLLHLFIGPRFGGTTGVLPFIVLASVIDAFYFPASNYIFYVGRTTLIPIVTAASAIVGTGLAVLLLPRFGLAGLLASRVAGSVGRSAGMMLAAWWVRRSVAALDR